jgi:hypothetical protein
VNEAAPNIEGAIWILNHIIQEKYKEGEARDWKEYAEEMRDTYVNVRKLIQSLIVTYIYIYIFLACLLLLFSGHDRCRCTLFGL